MVSIRTDIEQLYRYWMSFRYPRQQTPHPVLGYYRPDDTAEQLKYYSWGSIGIVLSILLLYPTAVVGLLLKRGVDSVVQKADDFGVWETLFVLSLVWTILISLVTHLHGIQSGIAVSTASLIALFATLAAFISRDSKVPGTTVLIAYPSAYTALFLPPITAAVISPYLGEMLLYYSILTAEAILTTVASPIGVSSWFRTTFTLEGIYHVIMWAGISLSLGWFTGTAVALARKLQKSNR